MPATGTSTSSSLTCGSAPPLPPSVAGRAAVAAAPRSRNRLRRAAAAVAVVVVVPVVWSGRRFGCGRRGLAAGRRAVAAGLAAAGRRSPRLSVAGRRWSAARSSRGRRRLVAALLVAAGRSPPVAALRPVAARPVALPVAAVRPSRPGRRRTGRCRSGRRRCGRPPRPGALPVAAGPLAVAVACGRLRSPSWRWRSSRPAGPFGRPVLRRGRCGLGVAPAAAGRSSRPPAGAACADSWRPVGDSAGAIGGSRVTRQGRRAPARPRAAGGRAAAGWPRSARARRSAPRPAGAPGRPAGAVRELAGCASELPGRGRHRGVRRPGCGGAPGRPVRRGGVRRARRPARVAAAAGPGAPSCRPAGLDGGDQLALAHPAGAGDARARRPRPGARAGASRTGRAAAARRAGSASAGRRWRTPRSGQRPSAVGSVVSLTGLSLRSAGSTGPGSSYRPWRPVMVRLAATCGSLAAGPSNVRNSVGRDSGLVPGCTRCGARTGGPAERTLGTAGEAKPRR